MLLVEIKRKAKTLFLPKISAEISAETLSVINLLSACLQKEPLLAERLTFGRKSNPCLRDSGKNPARGPPKSARGRRA